jgi:hypothetical protein
MALQRDKKTPNVVATERLLHARSLRGIIWTRTVMKNYGHRSIGKLAIELPVPSWRTDKNVTPSPAAGRVALTTQS